ncbi:STAS domain-containing protein [Streptomyces sp. NPDC001435]|uniref:STAS domain-containing protein n=1 Tax=unclassified Streptomyces TaxID=2593676 RepID=UPI0036BB8C4D
MTFIDCSGLRLLCRARNRVRARQGRLRLVADTGRSLHILQSTCLGGVFEIHPGLPPAPSVAPHEDGVSAGTG